MKKILFLVLICFITSCNSKIENDKSNRAELIISSDSFYEPEIITSYDEISNITNTEIGEGENTWCSIRTGYYGEPGDTIQ